MYRRYSQVNDGGATQGQVLRNRVKNILLLLLVLAVAALCFFGVPAIRARQEQKALMIQRIQAECDEALRLTATLSRNAGADSAAILAKIRSNLYAIRTVNNLSNSSGFGLLLNGDYLSGLQDQVDRYLSYITTGMDTGEYQTNLQNSLNELQGLAETLES